MLGSVLRAKVDLETTNAPKSIWERGVLGTFVLFLLLDFIGGHSWAGEVDGGTRAVLTSKEKRKKLKNSPS